MALKKTEKTAIVEQYHVHPSDTGSPEVQIALLTTRINQLVEHLTQLTVAAAFARVLAHALAACSGVRARNAGGAWMP